MSGRFGSQDLFLVTGITLGWNQLRTGGDLLNLIDERFAELEEQVSLAHLIPQLHDRPLENKGSLVGFESFELSLGCGTTDVPWCLILVAEFAGIYLAFLRLSCDGGANETVARSRLFDSQQPGGCE